MLSLSATVGCGLNVARRAIGGDASPSTMSLGSFDRFVFFLPESGFVADLFKGEHGCAGGEVGASALPDDPGADLDHASQGRTEDAASRGE